MADTDIFGIPRQPIYVDPREVARRQKQAAVEAARAKQFIPTPDMLDPQSAAMRANIAGAKKDATESAQVTPYPDVQGGLPSLVAQNPYDQTGLDQRIQAVIPPPAPGGIVDVAQGGEAPPAVKLPAIPHDLRDASVTELIRNPFENPARIAGRSAGFPSGLSVSDQTAPPPAAPKREEPPQSATPDPKDPTKPADPATTPVPPATVANPTGVKVGGPGDMVNDILTRRAQIDQIYPQEDFSNPKQDRADAYAEQTLDRTKLMAQLAFFAGITKSAGGDWEAVGQGLAAGGDAYDKGFSRYQNALQGQADRSADIKSKRYANDVGRTDAALKLYAGDRAIAADNYKESLRQLREDAKERNDMETKGLELQLEAIGGSKEYATPEQIQAKQDIIDNFYAAHPELRNISKTIDLRKK